MDKRLSQEEMNALLSPSGGSRKGKQPGTGNATSPMAFDFRRRDRLSKGMMESLRTMHEKFATGMAAGISGRLRSAAEVTLVSVEQLNYGDFISTLPESTYLAAVAISPMDATAGIQCNLELAFHLIDRLTGGSGGAAGSDSRTITEIERNILDDVVGVWLRNLEEVWSTVTEFRFRISGSDLRPEALQISDPDQIMIAATFQVKIDQLQSQVQICIPLSVVEPIKGKLEKNSEGDHSQHRSDSRKAFTRLLRASLQLTAELPTTKIPLKELTGISVNDVVLLDVKVQDFIVMNVAGRRSFCASLVQSDGQKSVRLISHEEGSAR
jgi:flagellar motor switch protein FliM